MSKKDDGGPAFGQVVDLHCVRVEMTGNTEWEPAVLADSGMRLRDYFAAKVLPSVFANLFDDARAGVNGIDDTWRMAIAIDSYAIADAMIEARKR